MKVEHVLYYLKIHMQYFKSISQKTKGKSQEKLYFAKGNNSRKRRSNAMNVNFDLCYLKTNLSTKFQGNTSISKNDLEKFGNWVDGHREDWWADGSTDWLTDGEPIALPVSPLGD